VIAGRPSREKGWRCREPYVATPERMSNGKAESKGIPFYADRIPQLSDLHKDSNIHQISHFADYLINGKLI